MVSSILFCCTLNSVRSPIAEALAKKLFGVSIYINSVGCDCGPLDGFMVEVMQEIDIDMSAHKAKKFDMLEDDFFEIVVALSKTAYEKAKQFAQHSDCELLFWDCADPSEEFHENRQKILKAYRDVRDQISDHLEKLRASTVSS